MLFRNNKLDRQMENISFLLTAIEARELGNLKVMDILKVNRREHPEMSMDKATEIGMQRNARKALLDMTALATSFDRVLKMTEQMIETMVTVGLSEGLLYKKRLEILTDFDKITKELTPAQSIDTGHRVTIKDAPEV